MQFSPTLEQLIAALQCLPGVGQKTAQRMAFQLLTRHRENGKRLAQVLANAMTHIQHCTRCRIFSESELCEICAATNRDHSLLCIVENPIDVSAIEQTGTYKGRYFVLLGRLSPLDGITPEHIGIPQLTRIFAERHTQEVILATNPTVEGEATAHFISELAKQHAIKISRIARGVAIGSELEYSDPRTLAHALTGREVI